MKYLVTLMFCFLLPINVIGGPKSKTIRIGKMYSGKQVLKLKVLMSQQHANIKVDKKELLGIKIEAKSQRGKATAALLIGPRTSNPKTIDGFEFEFMNKDPDTLYRIAILNPNPGNKSAGNWQLKLNGNIFVQSITLILKGRKSDVSCIVDPRNWARVIGTDRYQVAYKGKKLSTLPFTQEICQNAKKSYIARKNVFCMPTSMEMFYHPYNLKSMKNIKNKYNGKVAAPVPYNECVQFLKKRR